MASHKPPVPAAPIASPPSRPRAAAAPLVEKIDEPVLAAGTIVDGKYRVVKRIAAGGMGEIYSVDTIPEPGEVSERRALKIIKSGHATAEFVLRFGREFEALKELNHPNILKVYDYGAIKDVGPYFTMELLEGRSLSDLANASLNKSLPWQHVVEMAIQACDALEAVHKRFVHRDVKPGNIFLTTDGRVKLLDFGLAIDRSTPAAVTIDDEATRAERLTSANTAMGTPQYMAPEQFTSGSGGLAATIKSDMYSIGALLFKLLSGKVPFEGNHFAVYRAHIEKATVPQLNFECSDADIKYGLVHIIGELLSRTPDLRPSATGLRASLRKMLPIPVDLVASVTADPKSIGILGESDLHDVDSALVIPRGAPKEDSAPVLLLSAKKKSEPPASGRQPSPPVVGVMVGVIGTAVLLAAFNYFKPDPEPLPAPSPTVQDAAVDVPRQVALDSISPISPVGGDVRMFAVEAGGIRRLVRTISDGATFEYQFHTAQVLVFEPAITGRLINGTRSIRVELDPNNPPTVRLSVTSRPVARPPPPRVIRTVRSDASAAPRPEEPEEVPEVEPAE